MLRATSPQALVGMDEVTVLPELAPTADSVSQGSEVAHMLQTSTASCMACWVLRLSLHTLCWTDQLTPAVVQQFALSE